MKANMIKYKITLWYTGILMAVLVLCIACVLVSAEYFYVREAKTELTDEVSDFYKELTKIQDTATDLFWLPYYDDGVVITLYDSMQEIAGGFYPDNFPVETSFEEEKLRVRRTGKGYFMVYDRSIEVLGESYWIRGIYDLSLLEGMRRNQVLLLSLGMPFLLLFTGFIGYRMIRKALYPIYAVTRMAKDITDSTDLSLRLPEPKTRDELACLTETFNYMLDHLEDVFKRETQFTSDAAHELRTPLSVIISHCEYCLADLELEEELREELTIIERKARSMSELVSQLLVIARAEGKKFHWEFEETDLKVLAETVAEELGEKAEKKQIRITVKCGEEPPVISCDFSLIMQMMINLVDNAVNYGREGGSVEIQLQKETEGCTIRVRDDGIGIPAGDLDRIWNRFYRVDESHSQQKGFGLGLFMVKWIVELHGGTVNVKSMPELGSIFTVHLPERREA